jgi:hypothetical protein
MLRYNADTTDVSGTDLEEVKRVFGRLKTGSNQAKKSVPVSVTEVRTHGPSHAGNNSRLRWKLPREGWADITKSIPGNSGTKITEVPIKELSRCRTEMLDLVSTTTNFNVYWCLERGASGSVTAGAGVHARITAVSRSNFTLTIHLRSNQKLWRVHRRMDEFLRLCRIQ